MARLTPLGWSCTGPVSGLKHGSFQTRFAHTYFVRESTDTDEISRLRRGSWEIESYGTLPNSPVMSPEEQCALEKVKKSLKYVDGRYQVGIPWKKGNPVLPDNLNDVLLRCRRYPVALICDIAARYLRIEVMPKDRSCQRFLWTSLDERKKPDEYEFTRVVFGVNSSPFQAQLVSQSHAKSTKTIYPWRQRPRQNQPTWTTT